MPVGVMLSVAAVQDALRVVVVLDGNETVVVANVGPVVSER